MEKPHRGLREFLATFKPRPVPVVAPKLPEPVPNIFESPHAKVIPGAGLVASGSVLLAAGRISADKEEVLEVAKHYEF